MGLLKTKKISKYIIIIYIFLIKCQGQDFNPHLKDLMEKYDESMKDSQIYKTIINVLIGTNIFLFIIILSLAIYEIVNCQQKRKLQILYINSFSKKSTYNTSNNSNIQASEHSSGNSNIKNSSNSFNSSKVLDSVRSSNDDDNKISNNSYQKPDLKESTNSFRDRSNSGYEAPIIKSDSEQKKEDNVFTNEGNDNNDKKDIHLLENPY